MFWLINKTWLAISILMLMLVYMAALIFLIPLSFSFLRTAFLYLVKCLVPQATPGLVPQPTPLSQYFWKFTSFGLSLGSVAEM